MNIISNVKLGEILKDLKVQYPEHSFRSIALKDMTEEDKKSMDILISHDGRVDEAFLSQCPNLKWIAWYAAGVNKLPLETIKERNIILTNARGVHKIQISEYIFSYIMTDYKNVLEYYNLQQAKGFKTDIRHKELFEQTICFIGTGEIPSYAARIAQAFNMKVIGINTTGQDKAHFDEVYAIEERIQAFEQSDIIVNVLPETASTIDLLKAEDFKAMGSDALFINVGRGTVVKEDILMQALKDKVIRFACLDVFYNEPLEADHPLYTLDNVIMTPHITGLSTHYNQRATNIFIDNMNMGIDNKDNFKNLVDLNKGY